MYKKNWWTSFILAINFAKDSGFITSPELVKKIETTTSERTLQTHIEGGEIERHLASVHGEMTPEDEKALFFKQRFTTEEDIKFAKSLAKEILDELS